MTRCLARAARPGALLAALLWSAAPLRAQGKADIDAIQKLIDQYGQTEDAGDMMAQAKLMMADRVWIGQAQGRQTDQAMNMRTQQAEIDAQRKQVPGVQWFTEARDRLVKFYGNGTVAVASFYWYRTAVLPSGVPKDVAANVGNVPALALTLVLAKDGGDWKIAHTHVSELGPPARQ